MICPNPGILCYNDVPFSRLGLALSYLLVLLAYYTILALLRVLTYTTGLTMKTYFANNETIENKWYLVDASGKVLGRLASQIAKYLRGKHKPEYTPHCDTGDYIVVINADQIKVTGNKAKDKVYYRHSGYPGGLKETTFDKLQAKDPTQIIEIAVKGMLPKNPLGRDMLRKLKVYSGAEHPHAAQQPVEINLEKAE
jgi:large subunit ribosomal protein L13